MLCFTNEARLTFVEFVTVLNTVSGVQAISASDQGTAVIHQDFDLLSGVKRRKGDCSNPSLLDIQGNTKPRELGSHMDLVDSQNLSRTSSNQFCT